MRLVHGAGRIRRECNRGIKLCIATKSSSCFRDVNRLPLQPLYFNYIGKIECGWSSFPRSGKIFAPLG